MACSATISNRKCYSSQMVGRCCFQEVVSTHLEIIYQCCFLSEVNQMEIDKISFHFALFTLGVIPIAGAWEF
jgi:hypothetical protein